MWINFELLEFGFYIGEYGTEQQNRFSQNCQVHYDTLLNWLTPSFADVQIVCGKRELFVIEADGSVRNQEGTTFADWLQDPAQYNFDVSYVLPKVKVLQFTADQLRQQIIDTYQKFFPLVLLAIEDDPLPHIQTYLRQEPVQALETSQPVAERQTIPQEPNSPYSLAQCAEETGYSVEELTRWVRAIERKGQAVFYGPPGTGKTYIAERLARHLIGGGDGFVELVQFHPAYAYEDFMQGIRPLMGDDNSLRYEMVHGRFYTFCHNAKQRGGTCVFIIDEINRANVAGVFGELMYLLEYRDQEIALSGGGRFSIPGNVRILATMNTADRSIALVDHALRRRFAFIHLPPNYHLLRHYHQTTGYNPTALIRVLDRLNKQINDPHYQLGTSFFMRPDLALQLEDIWRMEVEPYLEEYFFDQTNQIEAFRWHKIQKEIGD
ncbi:MAG: AAA family ATPase [Ardenticatenaceae bacterium]|nr:AAA family ATPase [Ardenticatenaceae bacterium]